MESLSLEKFSSLLGGSLTLPQTASVSELSVENVSIHSDRIASNCVFFALKGARGDGHNHIDAAIANGCAAVVTTDEYQSTIDKQLAVPHIAVPEPLAALQKLAAWWRTQLDKTKVIAITGSTGKTITKDALVHLCTPHFRTYGSPGSFNSQLGVPLALLECPRTAEFAFIEVAASQPGEMETLAPLVAADHVVITNVNTRWQHNFTSRHHQITEMFTIANVGSSGWIVAPGDESVAQAASKVPQKRCYTNIDDRLCRFESNAYSNDGVTAKAIFPSGARVPVTFATHLIDLAQDIQLAASVAHLLGVDESSILRGLAGYSPTAMRTELWRSPKGFTIMRAGTTPDPLSFASAIEAAQNIVTRTGKTYFVLGMPETPWTSDQIADFTSALAAHQQLSVYGFDTELHRTIAASLKSSGQNTVDLASSVEALSKTLLALLAPGDVCLIQSPKDKELAELGNVIIDALAPNRLHVDLSALEHNVTAFRKIVGPNVKITAMVKALAYGSDATAISHALERIGIDYFGVSTIDEGVQLRQSGISKPIMAMLATDTEIEKAYRSDIEPVVYSPAVLELVLQQGNAGRQTTVHLEVNSGMNRAGLKPDAAKAALDRLAAAPNVTVAGLMTHMCCADEPQKDSVTVMQHARYQSVVDYAHQIGLNPICHAANSAASVRFKDMHFDMVRIGLGLYGLYPDHTEGLIDLKPVARFMSRLVQIIDVPEGEGVGYGHTFTAPSGGARIGVIPAGYFDGMQRLFSNKSYVVIAGKRCPMVGNISMDSMTVDVSDCEEAVVGSDVLLYGKLDGHSVAMETVADSAQTIPYELAVKVGPRVQRIFSWH